MAPKVDRTARHLARQNGGCVRDTSGDGAPDQHVVDVRRVHHHRRGDGRTLASRAARKEDLTRQREERVRVIDDDLGQEAKEEVGTEADGGGLEVLRRRENKRRAVEEAPVDRGGNQRTTDDGDRLEEEAQQLVPEVTPVLGKQHVGEQLVARVLSRRKVAEDETKGRQQQARGSGTEREARGTGENTDLHVENAHNDNDKQRDDDLARGVPTPRILRDRRLVLFIVLLCFGNALAHLSMLFPINSL